MLCIEECLPSKTSFQAKVQILRDFRHNYSELIGFCKTGAAISLFTNNIVRFIFNKVFVDREHELNAW